MLGREYLFERPSLGESRSESAMRNTEPARPISEAVSFAVVGEESRLSSVLSLFQLRCPAAVVLFVVAIAIFPVDRSLCKWLRSHILKEVDKRIEPPLADCDPATAVVVIFAIASVVASSLHLLPGRVFGRLAHASRVCTMAAAGLGSSAAFTQVATSHSGRVAALASTLPARIARFSFSSVAKNRQFSVGIACLIFDAGWNLDKLIRRHDSTPEGWIMDRAKAVHNNCLGSFYCSTHRMAVQ